jgi:hypothetical protein
VRVLVVAGNDHNCTNPYHESIIRPALNSEFYVYCPAAGAVMEQYVLNGAMKHNIVGTYVEGKWVRMQKGGDRKEFWGRRTNLEGMKFKCLVEDYRQRSQIPN